MADGIDEGPGSPGRLTIFTGARGVGKMTLLDAVDDVALERGWLFIDETATDGGGCDPAGLARQGLVRAAYLRDFLREHGAAYGPGPADL